MKLRTEIILLVGIVAVGVGLGSSFIASNMFQQTLEKGLQDRATIAALSLSEHILPHVKKKEVPQLESEITNLLKRSTHFQYAFVVDFDGNILAHSFDDSFPENLVVEFPHHGPLSHTDPEIYEYESQWGPIMDIGLPFIEGSKGHLHIGLNKSTMESRVATLRQKIITLTLLLALAGVSIGLFFSWRLTEPVQEELKKRGMVLEQSPTSIVITDAQGKIEYVNPKFEELTGYTLEESIGETPQILKSGIQADDHYKTLWETISQGDTWHGEFSNKKKNGELYWELASISPILNDQHEITHYIAIKEDITERKKIEIALKESENRTRMTFNSISDAVFLHPLLEEGFATFVDVNDTACKTYGYSYDQFLKMKAPEITRKADANQHAKRDYRKVLSENKQMAFETTHVKSSGEEFPVEINSTVILLSGVSTILSVVRDLTARKEGEKKHENLQAQFAQAQKMETVGRLAGGVAHDFNNMLGVIAGHSELALFATDLSQTTTDHLIQIRKTAERSAKLTRQLLAFARKQTINPKVLDMNEAIEDMLKMLRHLIGEDIDLKWHPGKKVFPVIMDPSQVDQIMANLCVNARDAIADVGKITIRTDTASFDENDCVNNSDFIPGQYTLIAVSDDGCGFDNEILKKLFEPFFTTKPEGQGTGLGLSTIYGIVKQNNGFIGVTSKPGQGATFNIYLPEHEGLIIQTAPEAEETPLPRGDETILLVEDSLAVLNMTANILEKQGYTILCANSPMEAIKIGKDPAIDIQLLVTDVVMPEINGKDLALQLQETRSDLKCLFMSGYASNVLNKHSIMDGSIQFIAKPFSIKELASKVRSVLDDIENG